MTLSIEELEARRTALEAELGEPITVDGLTATFRIFQRKKGHRHSTDDLLTAWYALEKSPPVTRALDLGTGIGTVGLLVLAGMPEEMTLTCIEAQDVSYRFLRENLRANGVEARVLALHGDLRDLALDPGSQRFPLVTGSPPYFDVAAGIVPADSQKAHARFELRGDVSDYARAAKRHLADDGLFVLCFPWPQKARALAALRSEGFASITHRDVVPRTGLAPLFSLFACKLGPPGAIAAPATDVAEPPFVVRREDGSHTQAMHDVRARFGWPPSTEGSTPKAWVIGELTMKHTMDMPARIAPLDVEKTGPELLRDPLLNKGTAFTEEERDAFGLHGLLPPHVGSLEGQLRRRLEGFRAKPTDLEKYVFLRGLQDNIETLFYALLGGHLEEMLPIVYTPAVGEGCIRFSDVWSKPRGLFISYPHRDRIEQILADPRLDGVEVIVVSDGERILGLGDQGAGGMGIPIGKLSLYTACAGIHPATTLPILLDVGTDNEERLADPLYIGWRSHRVRGQEYDDFVEAFVSAVTRRWPNVLLQWEDFARQNAGRLLERYRDRLCTFNDDIQGTAAVAAGTLLAAIAATGGTMADQRIVIFGAGTAGCGIGSLLLRLMVDAGMTEAEARSHFYAVDQAGLLVDDMPGIEGFQRSFTQTREAVAGWTLEQPGEPPRISLLDVMNNAKPTTLIGVSGQAGAFSERVVRAMARGVERPVIFPLSNPTLRSEASPQDLLAWTEGRAIVGTGSPFPPVMRGGHLVKVDQTNNSYIFPGVGLGVLAVGARRVTDRMFEVAARTLASASPARTEPTANLLPPVTDLRRVAVLVARAVARQARAEGLCDPLDDAQIDARIDAKMWEPSYRPYRKRV